MCAHVVMPAARTGRGRARIAARWRRSQSGVAAVEFALVLPVMILMLLGLTEVTSGVNMDRKLTLLSRSLADLSSRESEMSATAMQNIFTAARSIMMPYDTSKLGMTVSSVKVTQSGTNTYTGSIEWSCNTGYNPTTRSTNSAYTVPDGFKQSGAYFMLVETKLPYRPMFGYVISGTINLAETTPWPVRNVTYVKAPSSCS